MTQAEKSLLSVTDFYQKIIHDMKHKQSALESLVRQVLNDLPSKRDWLDPQLEEQLRTAVKANSPSSNHRALLDRWALNDVKPIQKLARKNGMT